MATHPHRSKCHPWSALLLGLLCAAWAAPLLAQDVLAQNVRAQSAERQNRIDEPRRMGPEWVPIAADRLASYRGGYELPSGLLLSFGIERVAFVNGQLVSSLRIQIPDIGNMTVEQAQDLARLQQTQLVQIGAGNVFDVTGINGLVIQNTLDGQDIRAQTTIDVSVNTLNLFQGLNAADVTQFSLIGARGAP